MAWMSRRRRQRSEVRVSIDRSMVIGQNIVANCGMLIVGHGGLLLTALSKWFSQMFLEMPSRSLHLFLKIVNGHNPREDDGPGRVRPDRRCRLGQRRHQTSRLKPVARRGGRRPVRTPLGRAAPPPLGTDPRPPGAGGALLLAGSPPAARQ